MKAFAVMGMLVVAGCASSGGAGGAGGNIGNPGGGDADANIRHVEINGGQAFPGSVELSADAQSRTPAVWHDISAPAASTWQYLPIAYGKLGLAITRYDSTTHLIEGERLRSKADFGGAELKSLMDCGDVEGMPNVTRFDVNIQVRTALRGSGKSSDVASIVTATAKPSGVAGVTMPCTVNSSAADRVAAAVVEAVAAVK